MQRFIFARASVPTGSAVEYALAHTGEQGRWGGEKRARLGGRSGLVMRSIANRRWSAHFTFSSIIEAANLTVFASAFFQKALRLGSSGEKPHL